MKPLAPGSMREGWLYACQCPGYALMRDLSAVGRRRCRRPSCRPVELRELVDRRIRDPAPLSCRPQPRELAAWRNGCRLSAVPRRLRAVDIRALGRGARVEESPHRAPSEYACEWCTAASARRRWSSPARRTRRDHSWSSLMTMSSANGNASQSVARHRRVDVREEGRLEAELFAVVRGAVRARRGPYRKSRK